VVGEGSEPTLEEPASESAPSAGFEAPGTLLIPEGDDGLEEEVEASEPELDDEPDAPEAEATSAPVLKASSEGPVPDAVVEASAELALAEEAEAVNNSVSCGFTKYSGKTHERV
jgi:hypothetical protein